MLEKEFPDLLNEMLNSQQWPLNSDKNRSIIHGIGNSIMALEEKSTTKQEHRQHQVQQ